jgi:hypothetical membrane protein
MSLRFIRLAALFGVLTPIVTLTLIFIAVAVSPWFDWHADALSDMGVGPTPQLFNATLIISGLMYLVFVIGFLRWHGVNSVLARIAAVFMLVGGIGLVLIGIFTEDAGRIHYVVAATYFLATPAAYLLLGIDWQRRGKKLPGLLSLVAGIAAFLMIALVPHKGFAVPEILASVVLGAWTLSMGMKLLIEPESHYG